MKKSQKARTRARQYTNRRNFLRIERLEHRMVLTGAAPVAFNDSYQLLPDETFEVSAPGILANDTDAEGDVLSAALFSGPAHGTLALDAAGGFQYTPEAGFLGIDSFMYSAGDDTGHSLLAAVTLHVEQGSPPIANNDVYSLDEDTSLVISDPGVMANDSDADSDPLAATLISGPIHGSLILAPDGSFTYTPAENFHGVDGFSYLVSDGTSLSGVATVTLEVNSVNDGPVAVNDEYSTQEDTPLTINAAAGLIGNDTDTDGDSLIASLVSGPAHGTLTLNTDGSFDYTPVADFNGVDGFSYVVSDGTTDSDVASVTLNVSGINDGPLAANDEYTTDEDSPLTIDTAAGLLANDSDPDSSSLIATMVSGPVHGVVTLNEDGSFSYTPAANFYGVDGFSYTVSDGALESDVATVTINVNAVNDAPIATADAFATDEDTPLVVDVAGSVLANDSDVDGDSLLADLVIGPAHGTMTLNTDGSFNYSPEANFHGSDSFVYTASDGSLASNEATVTITVNPVNDAPLATADTFATNEDAPLTISAPGLLANDSDVDGDTLSSILVSEPAHGTVSLAADGSFIYSPSANFNGSDSFTYQASDGSLTSGETTVSITVNSVPDAPLSHQDAYSTGEDVTLIATAEMGVLANDFDPQALLLTAELVSGPANGTLTLSPDGSFSYSPSLNYHGTDSFTYVANNGVEAGPVLTATIVVEALNDAPLAIHDNYGIDASGSTSVNAAEGILANDSDIDGDALSPTLLWGPQHGSLSLSSDGSFSYIADAGYVGADSFKYQLSDGLSNSNVATVNLLAGSEAGGENVPPVSLDDTFTVAAGSTLTLEAPGLLENDTDADSDVLTALLASGPTQGILMLQEDGSFSYTPAADFAGTDTFTYTASDGKLSGNLATVTIAVQNTNENHNPAANDDGYVATAETLLGVSASEGVLANDTDADGDPLTAVLVGGAAHGTVTLHEDGSFDYQGELGFTGADSFTYQASDGIGLSEITTVTINVGSAANHRPLAVNDQYTTTTDVPLEISSPGLLGNDSDPDGDPQTVVLFGGPQNGTLMLNGDGSFLYTPAAGFQGRDSFLYRTFDGEVHSALAAVTIYVNAAPNPPAVVQDENDSPRGCLLGGAIRSVLQHLDLARHGMEEDLLDSLATDQHGRFGDRLNSWLADDRWQL